MLTEASLATTAAALRSGDRSLTDHLDAVRDRMAAVEPDIHAFVDEPDRWDRVTADVDRIHDRYPTPARRPALYGVPIGVKDIFHVEGLETRAGSTVPPSRLTGPEAVSVSALKAAGAFVLGKTVTTEFAFYDPGPTRNPHDLEHTPGGSSSGSAAAVAAGTVLLALGTQTYGSVNRPASFCGVVGLKPSYGRIPIDGVLPLSPSADHVGFFTQDVPSAEIAAAVLYADWGPVQPGRRPTIGVPDDSYLDQADPATVEHLEVQVDALAAAGFEVTAIDAFDDIEAVNHRHHRMVAAEAAMVHDERYEEYGDQYGEELAALIDEGYDVSTRELAAGRTGRLDLRRELDGAMASAGVDVIVAPSAPGPAPKGLDDTGDPVMNVPWTHSGVPSLTIPSGTIDGLPVGLQFAARYGFDEWLLRWGVDLERALQ